MMVYGTILRTVSCPSPDSAQAATIWKSGRTFAILPQNSDGGFPDGADVVRNVVVAVPGGPGRRGRRMGHRSMEAPIASTPQSRIGACRPPTDGRVRSRTQQGGGRKETDWTSLGDKKEVLA